MLFRCFHSNNVSVCQDIILAAQDFLKKIKLGVFQNAGCVLILNFYDATKDRNFKRKRTYMYLDVVIEDSTAENYSLCHYFRLMLTNNTLTGISSSRLLSNNYKLCRLMF